MKRYLLLFVFFCLSATAFADKKDSSALKIFNVGLEFYKAGKLDTAVAIWTYIVDRKVGVKSDVYGNAFFNIPTILWQMKKFDKAKEWYQKVIASDLQDNDETGDLMEPHTNYKHKSAVALAGLYLLDSNYNEELNWLFKADTVYRYWGFEGSATNITQEQAYLVDWEAEVLQKQRKSLEAVRLIITELICAGSLESYFSKSQETLRTLTNKKFKEDFRAAIDKAEVIEVDDSTWVGKFTCQGLEYAIPITNKVPNRNIPHYYTRLYFYRNERPGKDFLLKEITSREFYRKL